MAASSGATATAVLPWVAATPGPRRQFQNVTLPPARNRPREHRRGRSRTVRGRGPITNGPKVLRGAVARGHRTGTGGVTAPRLIGSSSGAILKPTSADRPAHAHPPARQEPARPSITARRSLRPPHVRCRCGSHLPRLHL